MTVIHAEVNGIFERRFHKLTQQMLAFVTPRIAHLESDESALAELDTEIGNLTEVFLSALREPSPPFHALCDFLKQMNKYFNLRGLYLQQVDWAQALLAYFLAHEQATGETLDLAILNTIASGYTALGRQADAIDIYDFIIELYRDDKNHPGLATIFFNAANAHLALGHHEQAIVHCQRSIDIDRLHGNQRGIALALMMMADLLHTQKNAIGIFQMLDQAASLIQSLENHYLQAQLTGKLALYMAIYFDWERAETLFKQVIPMWRSIGDEEQLAIVLFNYASLLFETDRQTAAIQLARESLQLLEKYGLSRAEQVSTALALWLQEA